MEEKIFKEFASNNDLKNIFIRKYKFIINIKYYLLIKFKIILIVNNLNHNNSVRKLKNINEVSKLKLHETCK